jgi:hypothetical protein
MINMVEPTDPEERAAAIRICRANAGRHIITGHRLPHGEQMRQWTDLKENLPYSKWIWMWNNAQDEWDCTAKTKGEQ